ncbi:MAG TPA: sigma 54-interacting transcriptional regulator [Terriglobia bacterium]|nr:sigma 54-interacting transcriptional regulator [Terriglobia bacterium]
MFGKLFEITPDAIVVANRLGGVVRANPQAEKILGYDNFAAQTLETLVAPRFREVLSSRLGSALDDRHNPPFAGGLELYALRKDGTEFPAEVLLAPVEMQGEILLACIIRDITDRRRAEDTLLLQVTNVLVSNLDIRELLSAIGASLGQILPHEYASLAFEDPASGGLRLLPLDSPYEEFDPLHQGAKLPIEGSPEGWAFKAGKPLVLGNLEDDRFAHNITKRMLKGGLKSACFIPLIGRDHTLGTLNVARRPENAFTEKDVDLLIQVANQVSIALDNALAFRRIGELRDQLAQEKLYLQRKLQTEYSFEEIVGESPVLRRILKQVETVSPTDATVLILGETGTGKELIARAIHNLSPRRERIFVKFNCAAIPTGLLESELFGHEKGAFTGASAQRLGRLDLAHQGTLFLDEVGDIPLELQPKLLRALQEKEFERLGSTRTIPVDVRLIAATNRDLAKLVKSGEFRSDLYYRLKVFPILVPPLRERREDIPLLVRYFVQKHALRMNRRIETIPPEVMGALVQWDWPGNVRELGNLLERAVILTRGSILQVPLSELRSAGEPEPLPAATLDSIEREHIVRVLRETHGVVGGPHGAATRLGLNRSTLNSRMRKLKISRKSL